LPQGDAPWLASLKIWL